MVVAREISNPTHFFSRGKGHSDRLAVVPEEIIDVYTSPHVEGLGIKQTNKKIQGFLFFKPFTNLHLCSKLKINFFLPKKLTTWGDRCQDMRSYLGQFKKFSKGSLFAGTISHAQL